MIYSPDSVCVNEGKVISPLSCAAAPTSWHTESGDGRNEVIAVSQSRCVTCFHFSDMLVMSSSAPASPLIKVKLGPCSFLAAGINKCKQKEHGVCSQIIISKQNRGKAFSAFFTWPLTAGPGEGQVSDFHLLCGGCVRLISFRGSMK